VRFDSEHPMENSRPTQVAVPWRTRDVWLGVAAVALIVAVSYGLVYLLRALSVRPNPDLWVALFPNLFELLFLVPVWWFSVHKYHASPKTLGFVSFKFSILAVGLGLLFAFYVFNGFYASLLSDFGLRVQADLTPVFRQLSTPWPLFVAVVLVGPVAEETFFRGFVFTGLRSRYDWRVAAAISAALFAAAHLELTFFIPAFALGFLFAYLYQRSNSIWPGLIFHMLLNGIALTVAYSLL
jgi:membrane protease YdiL (CAAX protease family)